MAMGTIVDRLLSFIDEKKVTRREFYRICGFSNSFLSKASNIGSDKIFRVWEVYPDINLEWLITGQGEMLKPTVPINIIERKPEAWLDKLIDQKISDQLKKTATIGSIRKGSTELKKTPRG